MNFPETLACVDRARSTCSFVFEGAMKTTILWTAGLGVCVALASCGGSSDTGVTGDDGGATGDDAGHITGDSGNLGDGSNNGDGAGADSAVDAAPGMYGAPSTTYPAF